MQKDFHFYVIGILAKHAGFRKNEAIAIATSSQYVDHATESFSIQFDDGKIVETTMTAHYHIRSFHPGVQKKVFMCFHFPPEGLVTANGTRTFSFTTKENAKIVNDLLHKVLVEKKQGAYSDLVGKEGLPFYIYRLGIALHTLADSWSHMSFTGRHNDENDVGKIWFQKGTKWDRQYINDWKLDIAPAIGHAECGHYPDQPFRVMRYELFDTQDKKFKKRTRTNPNKFRNAAKSCLKWLNTFNDTINSVPNSWDDQKPAMKCIDFLIDSKEEEPQDRIAALRADATFKNNFGSLFTEETDYDPNRWRNEALISRELNDPWGEARRRDRLHAMAKPDFEKSSFRLFHKAAKLQRSFILDRLFW